MKKNNLYLYLLTLLNSISVVYGGNVDKGLSLWDPQPECTDDITSGHKLPLIAEHEYLMEKDEFIKSFEAMINGEFLKEPETIKRKNIQYCSSDGMEKNSVIRHSYDEPDYMGYDFESAQRNGEPEFLSAYDFSFVAKLLSMNIEYKVDSNLVYYCADLQRQKQMHDKDEAPKYDQKSMTSRYKAARIKLQGFEEAGRVSISSKVHSRLLYAENLIRKAMYKCNENRLVDNTCEFKFRFTFNYKDRASIASDIFIFRPSYDLNIYEIKIPASFFFSVSDELLTFVLAHELSHAIYNYDSTGGNLVEAETDYLAMYLLKNSGYNIEKYSNVWKEFFLSPESPLARLSESKSCPSTPTRHILVQKTIDEIRYKEKLKDLCSAEDALPNKLPKCNQ